MTEWKRQMPSSFMLSHPPEHLIHCGVKDVQSVTAQRATQLQSLQKNSTIISDKDTRGIYYSTFTSIFDISFEHEMIPTKKVKSFYSWDISNALHCKT